MGSPSGQALRHRERHLRRPHVHRHRRRRLPAGARSRVARSPRSSTPRSSSSSTPSAGQAGRLARSPSAGPWPKISPSWAERPRAARSLGEFRRRPGRRMVRAFAPDPVPADVLAGSSTWPARCPRPASARGWSWWCSRGPTRRPATGTPPCPSNERAGFPWPRLLDADVLSSCCGPGGLRRRYAEPDKRPTGLGGAADDWSVPYWHVDAGMAAELAAAGGRRRGPGRALLRACSSTRPSWRRWASPTTAGRSAPSPSATPPPTAPEPVGRPASTSARRRRPPRPLVKVAVARCHGNRDIGQRPAGPPSRLTDVTETVTAGIRGRVR